MAPISDHGGPWLVGGDPAALRLTLLVLLLSALASALLALLALLLRPARVRGPARRDYLVLLGIGLLVPVVGPLLMLLDVALFNYLVHRHAVEVQRIELTPFVPDRPREHVKFGLGGAVQGLRASRFDADQSIRALMAIEQERSANTSEILRETLGHPDESVRLTAAGLLNRRESRVLGLLRRVEQSLASVDSSERLHAALHLEAAELCSEMLYLRLAREGVARLYRERWGEHLEAARTQLGDTPRWLLARAHWLDQGGQPDASDYYRRAAQAGAITARVAPFLADGYWQRRDYATLRSTLLTAGVFSALPVVGPLCRRWGAGA